MKKIQEFTEEQSRQIEKVISVQYDKTIQATSIIKLLKAYSRQQGENSVVLDDVELEYVTDTVLGLLEPVQSLLCEVGGGAWYLLDERA